MLRCYSVIALSLTLPIGSSMWAQDAVVPVNLAVNSTGDEECPHSSVRNGVGHLFFTRGGELYFAQRNGQSWSKARPFDELNQHRGDYRSVFVSYQKPAAPFPHYLIYATNRDQNKTDGRGTNFDIYLKLRESATGVDVNVAIPLHFSTADDELHPWLTANGTLYFSRKTADGWRVFAAPAGKDKATFAKPQLVDLPLGFHHATLTPDGQTMYLQGPLDKDRWGLFRSRFENGKWCNPEEITILNDSRARLGNLSPSLTRDGTLLYFVSDRAGGKGGLDIWAVPTDKLKK